MASILVYLADNLYRLHICEFQYMNIDYVFHLHVMSQAKNRLFVFRFITRIGM